MIRTMTLVENGVAINSVLVDDDEPFPLQPGQSLVDPETMPFVTEDPDVN